MNGKAYKADKAEPAGPRGVMAARPSAARAGERGVVVDELAERGVRGPVVQRPELVPNSVR